MRHLILLLLVLVAVVLLRRSESVEVEAQSKQLSPGPAPIFGGKDYRVPIRWLPSLPEQRITEPGDYCKKFQLDGRTRYYEVHAPSHQTPHNTATTSTGRPVVLVFHGGYGYASYMRTITGLDAISDQHGFLVVYCAGTGAKHMDRGLYWNTYRDIEKPNDVAYVETVLDDLPKYFEIDEQRIYAMGISNGAQMTFRIGAELSDRIAAIGTVSGQRGPGEFRKSPTQPVPLIHFHGGLDTWCPLAGGQGRVGAGRQPVNYTAVDSVLKEWAENNKCSLKPEVVSIGTESKQFRYQPQDLGGETILYVSQNAGHTWPGGPPPTRFEAFHDVGKVSQDVNASELMWEFFKKQQRDEPQ